MRPYNSLSWMHFYSMWPDLNIHGQAMFRRHNALYTVSCVLNAYQVRWITQLRHIAVTFIRNTERQVMIPELWITSGRARTVGSKSLNLHRKIQHTDCIWNRILSWVGFILKKHKKWHSIFEKTQKMTFYECV